MHKIKACALFYAVLLHDTYESHGLIGESKLVHSLSTVHYLTFGVSMLNLGDLC